jgi:hypothetical protein
LPFGWTTTKWSLSKRARVLLARDLLEHEDRVVVALLVEAEDPPDEQEVLVVGSLREQRLEDPLRALDVLVEEQRERRADGLEVGALLLRGRGGGGALVHVREGGEGRRRGERREQQGDDPPHFTSSS